MVKIKNLSEDTSLADTDEFPKTDGSTTVKATLKTLREYFVDNYNWRPIDTTRFSTASSTSVLSMSTTSDFLVGYPVKFEYSSTEYYGIVTAVSSGASITIAGAPLTASSKPTNLWVGLPQMVVSMDMFIVSTYGDDTADLLSTDMNTYFRWPTSAANLVQFHCTHHVAAGTTQPKINVKINGSAVSTADSNNGVQLSTSGTWVANSAVAINTSTYDIQYGEAVEIACTAAETGSSAEDLTVNCVFVMQ